MADELFRYLEKHYVGKYRVLAPYDLDTEDFPRDDEGRIDEGFDDQYIPCQRGVIKCSYREDQGEPVFCWYSDKLGQGRNLAREIRKEYGKAFWYDYEEVGNDVLLYFKESDFESIAKLVNPRTSGAKIKPYSDKNLPKPSYKIPEKDLKKYLKLTEKMDHVTKMQFLRQCVSDFDDVIQATKGKKYDIAKERKKSKLKGKEFIHSIGMWEEYIKFIKEKKDEKPEED